MARRKCGSDPKGDSPSLDTHNQEVEAWFLTSVARLSFQARIQNHGKGSWSFVEIPHTVSSTLGTRARVPVQGTVEGVAVRTSLLPDGVGGYTMVVNREVQHAAGVGVGSPVRCVLSIDTAPRVIGRPADLRKALTRSRPARNFFDRLSYSHQKRYVDWLTGAKRPETRKRRLGRLVERLKQGLRPDG